MANIYAMAANNIFTHTNTKYFSEIRKYTFSQNLKGTLELLMKANGLFYSNKKF